MSLPGGPRLLQRALPLGDTGFNLEATNSYFTLCSRRFVRASLPSSPAGLFASRAPRDPSIPLIPASSEPPQPHAGCCECPRSPPAPGGGQGLCFPCSAHSCSAVRAELPHRIYRHMQRQLIDLISGCFPLRALFPRESWGDGEGLVREIRLQWWKYSQEYRSQPDEPED